MRENNICHLIKVELSQIKFFRSNVCKKTKCYQRLQRCDVAYGNTRTINKEKQENSKNHLFQD
jgi:hypothetical protein